MDSPDILELLQRHAAILRDTHVVYTSGRHGNAYVNKDAIYPHTEAVSLLCARMADRFADEAVDVVAGPTLGGVILAQWVAHHLSLRGREVLSVYAEKGSAGGFELRRGYDTLVAGKRVLVVEDVLTTGGSLKEVITAIRAGGGTVIGASALCNRGGVTAAQVGDPPVLHSLVDVNLESWDPAACPLCASGVPINASVGKGAEFLRARKGGAK